MARKRNKPDKESRNTSGQFRKGYSGNPSGVRGRFPKKSHDPLREFSYVNWNKLILMDTVDYKPPENAVKRDREKLKIAFIKEQGGRCAICHELFSEDWSLGAVIDHCHITGNVRGLVCQGCNKAMGFIKDSPDTALAMYRYLSTRKL